MKLDSIARLQAAWNRLFSQSREADLPARIVWVDEVDIQGNLAVDTHRLDFLHDRRLGAFEHRNSYRILLFTKTSIESSGFFRVKTADAPNIGPVAGCMRNHVRSRTVGDTINAFFF
jgi:hypothetical protein